MKMVEAEVEFDYDAVNQDELTLHKGDIIKNIKIMDGGWWEGELKGKRGMFPDNFVKVISRNEMSKSKSASMKAPQPPPTANGEIAVSSSTPEAAETQTVTKREDGSKKRMMHAKVAFSYNPQNEDELELVVNETVVVISQPEEGWWEGNINGKTGLFPSNFVTVIEGDAATPKTESTTSSAPASGGSTPIDGEKPHMKQKMGFGNIFAEGTQPLRKVRIPDKDKDVGTAKGETHPFALKRASQRSASTPALLKSDKTVSEEKKDEEKAEKSTSKEHTPIYKVRVTFDYEPKNVDELALKKGELINVLDKDAGDSGWWKGEINGRVGVFPDNFTEEIKEEEKSKKKSLPAPVPARPTSGVGRPRSGDFQPLTVPPRPTRPVSEEAKGVPAPKPAPTKQPSLDGTKAGPKDSPANGQNRHVPAGATRVLPPSTTGRPTLHTKPPTVSKTSRSLDLKDSSKDHTDSSKPEIRDAEFDEIKTSSAPLTHHVKTRPKAVANRRPPSTLGGPQTTGSSVKTPLSPLVSPSPLSTPQEETDGPTSDLAPLSTNASSLRRTPSQQEEEEESPQLPPWSRDIKKSLRKPPVQLPTQEKDHTPPRSPSPTKDTLIPVLAPRSKHKKHKTLSSLAPIPDETPSLKPSEPMVAKPQPQPTQLLEKTEHSPPSPKALKSANETPTPTLPSKPPPPDHPPRPASLDHPPSIPKDLPAVPASNEPPWKTELKNRNMKAGASHAPGAQVVENGGPSPARPKVPPLTTSSKPEVAVAIPPRPVSSHSKPPPPAVVPTPAAGTPSHGQAKNGSTPIGASSAEVQELKKEIKGLTETITALKTEFKKEVKKLMTEVDEEKKHRMMMQVELERIKTIVMEGD